MEFKEKLEFNKGSYTKTENKIYSILIEDLNLIERFTIMQMAEHMNVSHSAIMRFCQKLGFEGYSDFRYDYIKYAHSEFEVDNNNIISGLIDLYDTEFNNLTKIKEEDFVSLINLIKKYDNIKLVGFGKSSIPCQFMKFNFMRFGKYTAIDSDSVIINDYEKTLTEKDLIIVFSVSGDSGRVTKIIRGAEETKAHTVLITFNEKNQNISHVNKCIVIPQNVKNKAEDMLCDHLVLSGFVDALSYYYAKIAL